MDRKVLFRDVPLQHIALIGPSGYTLTGGTLLSRGGFASAEVAIPEEFSSCRTVEPHARSRFARLGLNVMLGHAEAERMRHADSLPTHIQVTLANYGSFPLLMRNGDTIALTNISDILTARFVPERHTPACAVALTGDQQFEIVPQTLAARMWGTQCIRYVDPHSMNWDLYTRSLLFDTLKIREGMFVVIGTRQHIHIPDAHIGIIHSTIQGAVHTSSVLVYPQSNGTTLLLEFLALRDFTLTRGDTLAVMTIHEADAV